MSHRIVSASGDPPGAPDGIQGLAGKARDNVQGTFSFPPRLPKKSSRVESRRRRHVPGGHAPAEEFDCLRDAIVEGSFTFGITL